MSQFDELPEAWEEVRIEEISQKVGSGATPRGGSNTYKQSGVPLIRSMNVHFDGLHEEGLVYLDDQQAEGLKNVEVKANDVLLNITGASIGRVTQAPAKMEGARVNQHVCIIRPTKNFDPAFLTKYLASPKVQRVITAEEYGMTRQALTKQMILDFEIPLPPINEQRRIVEKIEALTARSRKAREALEAIPALLDQFRQSVLAAAFRGDLTADWREQNPDVEPAEELLERIKQRRLSQVSTALAKSKVEEIYQYCETEDSERLPFGWQYFCLEKMCDSFQYGTSSKSHSEGEVAVLRMGNLQKGEIDWSDLAYSSDLQEIEKYRLNPGDVLFNRTNSPELVGKTSIYRGEQPAIFAGYLIRIKNFPELDSEYLNFCLNTNYAKAYCWQVKSDGVSQSNINAQKLAKFEIPLCSYDEQRETVRRIHNLLNAAKSIEDQYQESFAFSGQLNQSILAKAFRGELVPQDPNDEPASVLLERIRAERENLGGKKRAKSKA